MNGEMQKAVPENTLKRRSEAKSSSIRVWSWIRV
jgi:hypothetical protein